MDFKLCKAKIGAMFSRRETPENLWTKCEDCGSMLFHKELAEAMFVCPNCGFHMQISARERFKNLFDGGLFSEVEFEKPNSDPLNFIDTKKYVDRMKSAQKQTSEKEAMLVGDGSIGRMLVTVAAQDFSFMGGSMGMAVGNAIIGGIKNAVDKKTPFVLFSAAGGARMQESILSFNANAQINCCCHTNAERCKPSIYSDSNKPNYWRSNSKLCNAWRCADGGNQML